ncbi:MAG: PEP/pyruvate-binding domain-containing protein [Nitrospirota bacterium]
MTGTEKITTKNGILLHVKKSILDATVEVAIEMEKYRRCFLHWGLRRRANAPWQIPSVSIWPEGSRAYDHSALQTPFLEKNGSGQVVIRLDKSMDFSLIDFVLFFPEENRWDNNRGKNYRIEIPRTERPTKPFIETLREEISQEKVSFYRVYQVDESGQLSVAVIKEEGRYHVRLMTDIPGPLVLHWGVANRYRYEWFLPPSSLYPPGTAIFEGRAAQTPFVERNGIRRLDLEINEQEAPLGIPFVLYQVEVDQWLKDRGQNFFIPIAVHPEYEAALGDPELAVIAAEIIEKEMGRNSWTLMHRFNLCYYLLDRIKRNNLDGLALIFVWLRFSAIRQLDWQRNYNTKPRELGHSMDRLTFKLAARYTDTPGEHEIIRLIMTTLGRGTDAQRVRDEVLNIMHRHNIKEVSGHFMEEWHQKLHNNATPDDMLICEAYLEFLRSNGDIDRFYKKLNEGGVSKERLESYDRPIKSHPEFIPPLKDALIHDFGHFLQVLKEVHSGTDLETAIHTSRYLFDGELHNLMDFILEHRDDGIEVAEKITEARSLLSKRLKGNHSAVRELLFLDIALENFFRLVVERNLHKDLSGDQLMDLIALALGNLCLSDRNEEHSSSFRHWLRLIQMQRFEKNWSLQAKAVLDRLQRALGDFIDSYYKLLQPKAEFLGRAFRADLWTITLFTEEVLRGLPLFSLSMLLQKIDPLLRISAELGNWQVISPGQRTGMVEVVTSLKSIQGRIFRRPTIIVADQVVGNEEIPKGVVAIVTSTIIDILSHLSVRARNAHILFAICYDPDTLGQLKSLSGHMLKIDVNLRGDAIMEEISQEIEIKPVPSHPVRERLFRPVFTAYAIAASDFTRENVGAKSYNLKRLQDKLPKWIGIPNSVAVPFGVSEKVFSGENNEDIATYCEQLIKQLGGNRETIRSELLDELRRTILKLKAPDELISSLRMVMEKAKLSWPSSWENTWTCIKHVWASKWNERAYLSRRAYGIPHEDLFMAVLIQKVVEADYSFVIHTVNPFSGAKDEIYAEVVPGLGETLVGNYPGRAFSFTCRKDKEELHIVAFPSKSIGLFGSGLIFRSDSNGEDLAGYSGAGLYDSIMLPSPLKVTLDYTEDRLIGDERFQKDFLITVANIGIIIEKILKQPQDIEGAYSKGQFYIVQTRPQVGIERE